MFKTFVIKKLFFTGNFVIATNAETDTMIPILELIRLLNESVELEAAMDMVSKITRLLAAIAHKIQYIRECQND